VSREHEHFGRSIHAPYRAFAQKRSRRSRGQFNFPAYLYPLPKNIKQCDCTNGYSSRAKTFGIRFPAKTEGSDYTRAGDNDTRWRANLLRRRKKHS
jgi:hypothetical protein